MGENWTLHCDAGGHERGEKERRWEGKTRPSGRAEDGVAMETEEGRNGGRGRQDGEGREDSAEEGPDRRLGDRKGSRERSFGPDRLAKEEKGDPESRPCPDLGRETLGSLLHPACWGCLSFCICEVEMSPTPREDCSGCSWQGLARFKPSECSCLPLLICDSYLRPLNL